MQAASSTLIAHRGASGYRPEHTIASYTLAIEQGADYIEPDLVLTKDGVLVARHENEIGGTTDVANRPEFASRQARKVVDNQPVEGWFTEDFTLAELKTLRARERIPQIRPGNTRFDGQFEVPTFDEVLALARAHDVGVYPETKHPTYFDRLGLSHDAALIEALKRFGGTKVFIQSFEVENLKRLRAHTSLPMVQLIEASGGPFADTVSYAQLITPAGLAEVARYANAVGVNKALVNPEFIAHAHAKSLGVHAWTYRAEKPFLLPGAADMVSELRAHLQMGLDGFFTDNPDLGRRAVAVSQPCGSPK
jgi:glycerophosphoryl diester phosphodiesterase